MSFEGKGKLNFLHAAVMIVDQDFHITIFCTKIYSIFATFQAAARAIEEYAGRKKYSFLMREACLSRSLMSKVVENVEVGKIFSVVGIGQALVALLSHR